MKKHFGASEAQCLLIAGLGFATLGLAGLGTVAAQEQPGGVTPPPKVLVIYNEVLKPGRGGSAHQKTEKAFVEAFSTAKWPEHYMAMDALSGKERSIFFAGYDSFESWQKDLAATDKDAALSAALDSARMADGELLESHEVSAYVYREDLSLRAPVDIAQMRYMEITIFHVRSGHRQDWNDLAKMYVNAYQKVPNAHWAAYEKTYGVESGSRYIVITPMKSLAEADREMADDKGFASALGGADQMKKLRELTASALEPAETNVYMINPKMSYVSDTWVKADPAFWGQK